MTHNPNYHCQRCMGQDFEVVYQKVSDEHVYKCLDCGWEPTLVIDIPGRVMSMGEQFDGVRKAARETFLAIAEAWRIPALVEWLSRKLRL